MNVSKYLEKDGQSDGAIVGRGVLIDFYSFSKKSYDPFTGRSITAQEVRACASAQNIKFEYGDILIIRTGWSEAYKLLDQKGREEVGSRIFAGLARGQEMLELLHDNYFSAVASDAPALESWPTKDKETLHSFLLPRWGVPIGEMWDLDPLAELCKENNRYEFFLTSSPANVPGTVDDEK
jgi:kynurenine formamidase